MSIVTLTTDLGNDSFILAALKGALFSACPDIKQVIDISNSIRNYNIVEAAFVFSKAFSHFPPESIHVILINSFYGSNYELLLYKKADQFFIGPNNGMFPLIFEEGLDGEFIVLPKFNNTLEMHVLLGKTIDSINKGLPIDQLGTPVKEIYQKIALKPVVSKNIIRGTIIHIDRFGNLISNITKQTFERIRANRDFAVYFRHKDPITKISSHYHKVAVGDELCTFNMSEHLEIAINMGNASEVLGINLDDSIQIDFFDTNN
jgi:hypothetical protein